MERYVIARIVFVCPLVKTSNLDNALDWIDWGKTMHLQTNIFNYRASKTTNTNLEATTKKIFRIADNTLTGNDHKENQSEKRFSIHTEP